MGDVTFVAHFLGTCQAWSKCSASSITEPARRPDEVGAPSSSTSSISPRAVSGAAIWWRTGPKAWLELLYCHAFH